MTPAWSVHYDSGAKWSTKEQSYSEKNVSFSSSEGKQDGMDVEYSIGINVGDRQYVSYRILLTLKLTLSCSLQRLSSQGYLS